MSMSREKNKQQLHEEWLIEQLQKNPALHKDRLFRLENYYYILGKYKEEGKEKKEKMLFKLNRAQKEFYELYKEWDRFCILKSRQLGFSTLVALMFLDAVLWEQNEDAILINKTRDDATDLFDKKVMFAIRNLPVSLKKLLKFEKSSKREIQVVRDTGDTSTFLVDITSRGKTPTMTHISELGKIAAKDPAKAEEILTGSISAIASSNKLIIESTAEGAQGLFYETYMNAVKSKDEIIRYKIKNGMIPLFYNWQYDDDELATVETLIPVEEMDSSQDIDCCLP